MRYRMLLLASAAIAFAGCRHHCHKKCDSCGPPPPSGSRILLPPAGVPTTPAPSVLPPTSSGFPPPAITTPPAPRTGPDVLFPDPLPGNPSSRPVQPGGSNFLSGPVKAGTAEPPKTAGGLAGYTKVKDGLFAGAKPTLGGFDSLKGAGFRTVIYLHAAGADLAALKDVASTRDLNFVAIETTPETLAEAVAQFNKVAADKVTRPAYVFADDSVRAGAVWYLHFRTAEAADPDAARLRARVLGLSETGDEGKAFWVAILKVLEMK